MPVATNTSGTYRLGDRDDFFNEYFEFVFYRIFADVESYRNAIMMAPTRDEKEIFQRMVSQKTAMCIAMNAHCTDGKEVWFGSALPGQYSHPSISNFMLDNDCRPIESIDDAFHFAYRTEYRSLKIFELVSRSKFDTTLKLLLDCAAEHQRQHILYLDSLLSRRMYCAGQNESERVEMRWAMAVRS
jgi:hypothetical protein